MFLRLDNTDIPGLLSIRGYLDIRDMPDADVVAAILSRLGEVGPASRPVRAFTAKLPAVNPVLIGREAQIALSRPRLGRPGDERGPGDCGGRDGENRAGR